MFPDGTKFYPDIQDGISGYNTSEERGADTFHPFKNGQSYPVFTTNIKQGNTATLVDSIQDDYDGIVFGTTDSRTNVCYVYINDIKQTVQYIRVGSVNISDFGYLLVNSPIKKGDKISLRPGGGGTTDCVAIPFKNASCVINGRNNTNNATDTLFTATKDYNCIFIITSDVRPTAQLVYINDIGVPISYGYSSLYYSNFGYICIFNIKKNDVVKYRPTGGGGAGHVVVAY